MKFKYCFCPLIYFSLISHLSHPLFRSHDEERSLVKTERNMIPNAKGGEDKE